MDMSLSAEDEDFRQMVRSWLTEAMTPELLDGARKRTSLWQDIDTAMAWQRKLHERGWAAPDWPEEYGGTDWTITQRYIFAQECVRAETPALVPMSLKMCGPMLIGHGTEEQKAHWLPRILSGEDIWCQGYSEPGSGSDLVIAHHGCGGRRRLHRQRDQDLDQLRPVREHDVCTGPHLDRG